MIRHQYPTFFAGDLNSRHSTFGYTTAFNIKGRHLHEHILNNRLNYLGPTFNTFFTHNSATKPDCILTNNKFYHNYHITSGGIGPSDHITVDITISTKPIMVACKPIQDIHNTNWDLYKETLSTAPEINLEGGNILHIHNEFNETYKQINEAKNLATHS